MIHLLNRCFILVVLLFPLLAFSQSYQKIHRQAIVTDTHNDVLSTVTMNGMRIETDLTGKTHSDIARFKKGGIDVQVFSIFCNERFGKDTAFRFANIEMDSLHAIIQRNRATMSMVINPTELAAAIKQKNWPA